MTEKTENMTWNSCYQHAEQTSYSEAGQNYPGPNHGLCGGKKTTKVASQSSSQTFIYLKLVNHDISNVR